MNRSSLSVQSLFDQAIRLHQAGQLAGAEQLYRQILTLDPRHADSLHLLGVLSHQAGRLDIAAGLIGQAIAARSDIPAFYNNLGNVLKDQDRLNEAEARYRNAIKLKPDYPEASNNLGVVLQSMGKLADAEAYCRRAITLKPAYAEAYFNLGNILADRDEPDEAAACFLHSIALQPDADAHINLGHLLQKRHKPDEAMAHYKAALALKPDSIEALNNLGMVLAYQSKLKEAASYYLQAIALKPDLAESHFNLGQVLQDLDQFDEAIVCYERTLALRPNSPVALNDLGNIFVAQGRLDEAMIQYRRILTLQPDSTGVYNNLLFAMIYAASITPEELTATTREFGERIADPLLRARPLPRDTDPERKLRIGYVSPDFRSHAVNYFFEPLLKLHNRQQFEIFAYSSNLIDDAVTARLKNEFDHWRDIKVLNDDEAADLIESDQIDILIDPAGHTANNRLLVFARKPAPVQVTWLGFPATTGMKAIDYRITDVYAEPEGKTEHLNVETLWRLPEIFCCYGAHESNPAVIDHSPFEDNGYVTFGCFNNFAKVTDPVLAAWARIMTNVPDSRLLLEIRGLESPKFRGEVEARLQKSGLPLERVILEPRKRSNQFVLYNRIDIALDPFPCNGGTTSMDTLWMGVPFVTLAGNHFVSRMGVTFLTNVGMPELIAHSVDEYVRLTVDLALDRERLRGLRLNLRQRVEGSPLMNQAVFARNIEAAYREMWQRWCVQNGWEKQAQSRQ